MSSKIFGYGSTFMGVGEEGTAYYIIFKSTDRANPPGLISDENLPDFVQDGMVNITPDDTIFWFKTEEQRDRVFASFNMST